MLKFDSVYALEEIVRTAFGVADLLQIAAVASEVGDCIDTNVLMILGDIQRQNAKRLEKCFESLHAEQKAQKGVAP